MVVPSNSMAVWVTVHMMCTIPYVLQVQLREASRDGNVEMVRELLEQGVPVNYRDEVSPNIPHIVHGVFGECCMLCVRVCKS